MRPVDVTPADLETIRSILHEHAPGLEARAFGSRVSWTARETSDLDLALMTTEPLDADRIAVLGAAFTDSDLPFRVDIVDWAGVSENFRKAIGNNWTTLTTIEPPRAECEWSRISIGEIAEVVGGGTPSTRDPANFDGDVPWLTPKDLSRPHDRVVAQGARNLSRAGLANSAARLVPPGAVLLSTRAPIGYVAIAGTEMATNQGFRNLIVHDGVCPQFIFYWFKENTEELDRHASGTTFRELPGSALKNIRIPLPPLPEQHAIAGVLGALDDKIALNRRMNETLEAMVRALFESWFVDFSPVRAKMDNHCAALPPEFSDLFPGNLADSGTGEIPEGWNNGTLHDIASLNPESWSSKRHPDKIIYVDLTNTKWGDIENLDTFSWNEAPHRARRVLRRCDTIIATVRPGNGSFALIDEEGLTGSTGFAVLRPNDVADRELVWCAGTSPANIARLAHIADGGAYPAVRSGAVLATPVVLADVATREAFSTLAGPLLDKIEANRREARAVAALRDSLLPKLVSGELRVNVDDRSPGEPVR